MSTKIYRLEPPANLKRKMLAMAVSTLCSTGALALPQGAEVIHGDVAINTAAAGMHIEQHSQNAIVNWQSFSIGELESVHIEQGSNTAAMLSRVLGSDPSELLGQLSADGRLYLMNPNGLVVGEGASINAEEFIASTLDISDAEFLAGGHLELSGDSTAGILNLGSITTSSGDVVLVAASVKNQGHLSAPAGTVAVAAGQDVYLALESDQRLLVRSEINDLAATGIENTGVIEAAEALIVAAGGDIYDLAINQSGLIKATGIEEKAGRILLTAEGGNLQLSGAMSAQNANGSGGEIHIGGGFAGKDAAIVNAASVAVLESATLDVSGTGDAGDAGTIVVWSEENTSFAGTVKATAATESTGFVEISGKSGLEFSGLVDLKGAYNVYGELLLDPDTIIVATSGGTVTPTTLAANLASSNVTLNASTVDPSDSDPNGVISILNDVSWSSGNNLTLKAGSSINISGSVNAGSANLDLLLGFKDEVNSVTSALQVNAAATLTANKLTIGRNPDAAVQTSNSSDGQIESVTIDGAVNVATLDLKLKSASGTDGGIIGNVSIANSGNQIGSLTNSGDVSHIGGSLTVVDSSGGLSVSGSYQAAGTVDISAAGGLTLNSGASITTSGNNNVYLAATSGALTNNAGASAVSAGGTGRFLLYSDNPDNTTLGGLSATPVYNKTYSTNAPASITQTGNRVLYGLAPTLTLTAVNNQRQEGEANPALTFSISGLVGGDAAGAVYSGTPTLSTSADTSSAVGDYTISISNGTVSLSDYDYGLSLVAGTLTVAIDPDRVLTVTADDLARIYGESNPKFTSTISGFRSGDDASVVSGLQYQTTATVNSSVGTYSITPFGASASNYSFTYVPGTLTINLRDLTITADNKNKIFGEDVTLGFSASGLASFDAAGGLGVSLSSSGTSQLANVGTYAITPTGVTNSNYKVTYVNGTLAVTPAALSITGNDFSRAYGDSNPAFTVSTSGLVTGDTLDLSSLQVLTSATSNSDVGSYSLTPSGVTDSNYTISFVAGNLSITPAALTLTAADLSRAYGSDNPSLTYSVSGLTAGDTLSEVISGLTLSTPATKDSNAGSYTISVSGSQIGENYALTLNDGTLNVTKVDVDLFLNPIARLYGDENPTPTLKAVGLVNGDSEAVFSNVQTQVQASSQFDVGTYSTQLLAATATNYNIKSLNNGILTISPRPLTITANNLTREYGDANPSLTATFDGLASFDSEAVITGLTLTTPAVLTSDALDYGVLVSSDTNANYNITYQPGTLTVSPAVLSVELGDIDQVYGRVSSDLTPSINFLTPLKLDDTPDSLLFSVVTDAVRGSDVGDYVLSATVGNPNYTLAVTEGTLSILSAPLDIQLTNFSRIYGESTLNGALAQIAGASDAALGLQVAGLALGDTTDVLTIIDSTELETGVGSYDLTVGLNSNNYFVSSVTGGLLTILARQIAIKPDNIVRYYGDADPAFTYLVAGDGLASFDTIDDVVLIDQPKVSGSFGQQAPVGARTTLAQLLDNPNYVVANKQGYYVILPRPIEITVNDSTAVGNLPLPQFSFTATNLPDFETEDTAFLTVSYQIFQEDVAADVGVVQTPEAFEIPDAFNNERFFARFPSLIETPEAEFDAGSDVIVANIEPIDSEIIQGGRVSPVLSLDSNEIELPISSTLFTEEQQESEEPVIQYVRVLASNPNYVVVSNTNGVMTWEPDPEVAAQRREIEAEMQLYNEARDSLFDTSAGNNLLNLPDGAQQTILQALSSQLAVDAMRGNSDLANIIKSYGARARGTANDFTYLTGGQYSDFDMLAFLQAARTDPKAAKILGTVYSSYLTGLLDADPSTYSESEAIVIAELNFHATKTRDTIVSDVEAKYQEWEDAQTDVSNLADLYGRDVPYDEFLGEAAGDFVAERVTAGVVGAVAAGGTAAASAAGIYNATAVIWPFIVKGTVESTASIAAGTAAAGSSLSTATLVAGPAAIIGVAIAVGVAQGVQVFDQAQQKAIYDEMLASRGTPVDVTQLQTKNEDGEVDVVQSAILAGAITSLLGGA